MMKKLCMAAAGVAVALSSAAFADTPIGPGVTGSGGTGVDAADAKLRAGAGGETPVLRQDGMPADRADANVRGQAAKDAPRDTAKRETPGSTSVGASDGSSAGGAAGPRALSPAEAIMGK